MMLVESLQAFIEHQTFPRPEEFEELFAPDGHTFIDQEDVNWDFKDQWPFSYSNDYFLGIARTIAAFANTSGGFLIFGVHDQKRSGGHNKVQPNTDKLRQTLASYMGRCPEFQISRYDLNTLGNVDCLLILPRKMGEQPYRFIKETKYKDSIWVREGHSVVKAEPRHIPLLYCRITNHLEPIQGHWIHVQGVDLVKRRSMSLIMARRMKAATVRA